MSKKRNAGRRVVFLQWLQSSLAAIALTVTFFLVIPVIQAINRPPEPDTLMAQVHSATIPPPPPPPEEEPPPEDEDVEDEPPPELTEEAPPLDLSQLEMALNPGFGNGGLGGDFGLKLQALRTSDKEEDALFSLADLDQKPRVVYQPSPPLSATLRRSGGGTVYILFVVDRDGHVKDPRVQKSSNPVLDKPALDAIVKWRFEPGKRKGKPVEFKMRVPITFPK